MKIRRRSQDDEAAQGSPMLSDDDLLALHDAHLATRDGLELPDEFDKITRWAIHVRVGIALLDLVLAGRIDIWFEDDGAPSGSGGTCTRRDPLPNGSSVRS